MTIDLNTTVETCWNKHFHFKIDIIKMLNYGTQLFDYEILTINNNYCPMEILCTNINWHIIRCPAICHPSNLDNYMVLDFPMLFLGNMWPSSVCDRLSNLFVVIYEENSFHRLFAWLVVLKFYFLAVEIDWLIDL